MDKFKGIIGKLIVCLAEIAVGVVLLTKPQEFTRAIIIGVGILLCVVGALAVIGYFRTDPEEASLSQELARGILSLAAGIFCVYNSQWFLRVFPMLTGIYGVAALVVGVVKLQWTVDMLRLRRGVWQASAIASALSIILAVIVLSNPFALVETLWSFTAIVLIITGAADGVAAILSQKSRASGSAQE